ncbi:MAG TPA: DUF3455 domain-containing protein [Candidatus Acidoferrum sp.]|nr:DUF3455 domain-containing protein [Candidatus Acidoferrum sp.]
MQLLGVATKCWLNLGLTGLLGVAAAQSVVSPEVPENLKAPAGEAVVLRAHAEGVQIYSCAAGADGKYSWTLKAPKAQLFDEKGKLIGEHFAGPTWKLTDGSEVTGKAAAKHDAPQSDAIPWLLITVTGHKGSGALEKITTIQRVQTEGGVVDAAIACDSSKNGTETERPYSADYYFYAPRP